MESNGLKDEAKAITFLEQNCNNTTSRTIHPDLLQVIERYISIIRISIYITTLYGMT